MFLIVYTVADLGVGWWGGSGTSHPNPVSVKKNFCLKTMTNEIKSK